MISCTLLDKKYTIDFVSGRALRELEPAITMYAKVDTILNRLMSECYVLTSDFVYQMNRHGVPYGWGIAQYATPETFFGDAFSDTVYKRSPEESRQRLTRHLQELFPKTEETVIARFLRI